MTVSRPSARFGIRREDKSPWERRVPLTPDHVAALIRDHGIHCTVQPSPIRVFENEDYVSAGATVSENLESCPVVLAVKEIPTALLRPETTYLFFSHTIKGQSHNMPMLRRLLELRCQLIDYERIVDETGRRLVFFGRFAGLAGMIDTLWTLGQRLARQGVDTALSTLEPAHAYPDLDAARQAVQAAGQQFQSDGLPAGLPPLVFGFAGYGNVSLGAQEIFDLLPHETLTPEEVAGGVTRGILVKTVFKEEHLAEPVDPGKPFQLQDYYDRPEGYRSQFDRFLPHLDVLVNCIYWEPKYPRLITRTGLQQLARSPDGLRLKVVGDITCDVEGSVEVTVKATGQDDPVYTFDPRADTFQDGIHAPGVSILAVDNLPCELPRDASRAFGDMLLPLLPALSHADFHAPFSSVALPAPLKKAAVVYQGELTPDYHDLARFLEG